MYFKGEYTVRNLLLNLEEGETLRFDYGGAHKVLVEIRLSGEEDEKLDSTTDTPICTVYCQRNSKALIASMFVSLAQGKFPEGSPIPKPGEWFGDHVDDQGYVEENYAIPSVFLPQQFQDFTDQVTKEIDDYAHRTVGVLRWRYAAPGPHNPLSAGSSQWSVDGITWHPMPYRASLYVIANKLLNVDDSTRQDIESKVKQGATEPLGHEFFREAKSHQPQNPRSALVLAIVAAETGTKQCISTLAPDTQWLIENLPSPDLVNLIKEYLPTLTPMQGIHGKIWQYSKKL